MLGAWRATIPFLLACGSITNTNLPGLDAATAPSDASVCDPETCTQDGWCTVSPAGVSPIMIEDIWGSASDDVWAVGSVGQLLHWDGCRWSDWTLRHAFSNVHDSYNGDRIGLYAISGRATDDVSVVSAEGVMHWDGGAWSRYAAFDGSVGGIWSAGQADMFAAVRPRTERREIVSRWNGTAWCTPTGSCAANGDPIPGLTDFGGVWSIWGTRKDDVWIVAAPSGFGDGVCKSPCGEIIQEWNGVTWTDRTIDTKTLATPTRVRGTSPDNVWVLVSDSSADSVWRWNGSTWSGMHGPPNVNTSLAGLWVTGVDDVWLVGDNGQIWHWNGMVWSPSDSGTHERLYAIWGSSKTEIWVGSTRAGLLHHH